MATETSFGAPPATSPTQYKDWRKCVTLDPITHISFWPREGDRPSSSIKLINKGDIPIMFKIKTTKPNRYLVRPSQGVIGHQNEVEVQVLFTQQLDSKDEDEAIASDKFLVQLTPAPQNIGTVTDIDGRELMQQLINAWTTVDKKDKAEFRLKVKKRNEQAGRPADASKPPAGGIQEGPNATSDAQLQQEYKRLTEQLNQLQQERSKAHMTLSDLRKLEDSNTFDKNRDLATGKAQQPASKKSSQQGFQAFHLMLIALLSLILGAFISKMANDSQLGTGGDL